MRAVIRSIQATGGPAQQERLNGPGELHPLLHSAPTPASVRESFAQVTRKQVCEWVTKHVGRTRISKRRAAYAEHRKAVKGATS